MNDSMILISQNAFHAVLDTMIANASKGEAWCLVAAKEHVKHAIEHLANYRKGDVSEDHLGHAMTRIAMAMELSK